MGRDRGFRRRPTASSGFRADDITARWVGTGAWVRILGAAQDPARLLDAAPTDVRPASYAVGVVLGRGTTGEPMYYCAVGLRLTGG